MVNDPRFPPRHPPMASDGREAYERKLADMSPEERARLMAMGEASAPGAARAIDQAVGRHQAYNLAQEEGRGEDYYSPEGQIRLANLRDRGQQLEGRIASQQARTAGLEGALAGIPSELDKPAPGTRHTPRYWYGDDTADKARREAGGRETIREIKATEAAEKEGREEGYEAGITEGLKETGGEYERKVEIYSQLSPQEMEENYGGPRALTKPLYWENPKTGEREMTEAHKDYDPRKLKPVNYTDKQGRPRVKLVKVSRRKFRSPGDAPLGEAGVPPSTGDAGEEVGVYADTPVGRGEEHPPGAYTAAADPDASDYEKFMEGMAMDPSGTPAPGEQRKWTDEELEQWMQQNMPDFPGVKSSGEEAAAGDGEQARALRPEADAAEDTLGEARVRQQLLGDAQVFGGVPILGQKSPEIGPDGLPVVDEEIVEGAGLHLAEPELLQRRVAEEEAALAGGEGLMSDVGMDVMTAVAGVGGIPSAGRKLVDAMAAAAEGGVVGGAPEGPRVFGDPESEFERPGYTPEQLARQAATKASRAERSDYAESIRHGRRVAKEQAKNAPRFWYTKTGDPRADAAIAAQMAQSMGSVLGEQAKGMSEREKILLAQRGQQGQFDIAMKVKMIGELRQLIASPDVPYAMKQQYKSQLSALIAQVSGMAGGGGGVAGDAGVSDMTTKDATIQLEQEDPELIGQIDAISDRYGINAGVSGVGPLELLQHAKGLFGYENRTNNADQLHLAAQQLEGMIKLGTINARNVAAVGKRLGSKFDPLVLDWLKYSAGEQGIYKRGFSWHNTKTVIQSILAGQLPPESRNQPLTREELAALPRSIRSSSTGIFD